MSAHPLSCLVGMLWEGVCEVCVCFPEQPCLCTVVCPCGPISRTKCPPGLSCENTHPRRLTYVRSDTFSVSFPVHSFLPLSSLCHSWKESQRNAAADSEREKKCCNRSVKPFSSYRGFGCWAHNKKLSRQFRFECMWAEGIGLSLFQRKWQILSHRWTFSGDRKRCSFAYCLRMAMRFQEQTEEQHCRIYFGSWRLKKNRRAIWKPPKMFVKSSKGLDPPSLPHTRTPRIFVAAAACRQLLWLTKCLVVV